MKIINRNNNNQSNTFSNPTHGVYNKMYYALFSYLHVVGVQNVELCGKAVALKLKGVL